jgi:hypothetical protein
VQKVSVVAHACSPGWEVGKGKDARIAQVTKLWPPVVTVASDQSRGRCSATPAPPLVGGQGVGVGCPVDAALQPPEQLGAESPPPRVIDYPTSRW